MNDSAAPFAWGRDFRNAYVGNAIAQIGVAFQYVAVMWLAVVSAGPLGVVAVRLLDALPALLFAVHAGAVADRRDRRRNLIAANLARGLVLCPIAVLGLVGALPLWAVVVTAFALTTGASYYLPAFGALLPSLVGRAHAQRATGLVNATNAVVNTAGWAVAAALLGIVSVGAFFSVIAAFFFASALILSRVGTQAIPSAPARAAQGAFRAGLGGLRERAGLPVAVGMLDSG